MEFNKRMNKSGAVTIPSAMRRQLGLDETESFKITVTDDGKIQLKRIQGQCVFCDSDINLFHYMGRFICEQCLKKMNNAQQERSANHE